MNRPTIFNHAYSLQMFNDFGLDVSGVETLSQIPCLQKEEEEERSVQPLDDLSALVHKCNVKGSAPHPILSVGTPDVQTFSVPSDSQDSIDMDSKSHVHCKRTPQFHGWTKHPHGDGKQEESLKRKRSSRGDRHKFSEKLRRSEMNHLLAQMRSLLPNPIPKGNKASIVSETISYIQFLQRQLAILSKKHATTISPANQTSISTLPLKSESNNSMEETEQPPPSSESYTDDGMQTLNRKSGEENLTVKYNGTDIFITINCVRKEHLLPSIISVMESQNIQVMDAFVSTTNKLAFYCLRLKAANILDPASKETLHDTLNKLVKEIL